jgi:hypothetical protein
MCRRAASVIAAGPGLAALATGRGGPTKTIEETETVCCRSAIFAAPAGSYLALGWHRTKVRGAPEPSVLVLPEGCALADRGLMDRPPLPPGSNEPAASADPLSLRFRVPRAAAVRLRSRRPP